MWVQALARALVLTWMMITHTQVRGADVALLAAAGAPPALMVLHGALGEGAHASSGSSVNGDAREASRGGGDGCGSVAEAARDNGSSTSGVRPLRVVLLVGPEGDFTPKEVEELVDAGARPVGLGANRLRTETAAVALLSLCVLSVGGAEQE